MPRRAGFFLLFLFATHLCWGQYADSTRVLKPKRVKLLVYGGAAAYTGTMVGLSAIWYSDYESSGFHFFNDNDGWLLLDKMGHVTSTYYIGRMGTEALRWAGVPEKKAIWLGGSAGLLFLTSVEVLDGFSEEWGASPMDLVANTAGAALSIGQDLAWHEHRLTMKWSYFPSNYAQYAPDNLGTNFSEQWLKDYNGQTFWLSGNIGSFMHKQSKFPKWLNVAVGYGGNGMLAAVNNPLEDEMGNPIPQFERYRQWYFAPDIDLPRIKTNSKLLKVLFRAASVLKVPTPTLEYNRIDKLKFHWLFF